MKKIYDTFMGWVLTPLLFGLHFVTQHDAFLFIYASISFVTFLAVVVILYVYFRVLSSDRQEMGLLVYLRATYAVTKFRTVMGIIYMLCAYAYVLYVGAFLTAAFMLPLTIVLYVVMFIGLSVRRQFTPVEVDERIAELKEQKW